MMSARLITRLLPLALIALATLAVLVSGAARWFDLEQLLASRAWLHDRVAADPLRALALAALGYVGATVVSMPATLVLTAICGFLFGTVTGALLAVSSATTGAVIVFTVGRMAARDLVRRWVGARLGRFADGFRKDAFGFIVLMRILPLFPFWMTNLVPAALGVPLTVFAAATFLGLLPGAFVYAATGAGIEGAVEAHEAARAACRARGGSACDAPLTLLDLLTPATLAPLAALAILACAMIFLRRRVESRAGRR